MSITLFWHRRDLRLNDNAGLFHSLKKRGQVQPVFIFDTQILGALKDKRDARVSFLHDQLQELQNQYRKHGSDLWVLHGKPLEVFKELVSKHQIQAVFTNHDYEPSAIRRDEEVGKFLDSKGIEFATYKDQVIFEKTEIQTDAGKPYTVYTPFKNKWLKSVDTFYLKSYPTEKWVSKLNPASKPKIILSLKDLGFEKNTSIPIPDGRVTPGMLKKYAELRDFPAQDATTHLGLSLRFGTTSIRDWARRGKEHSPVWLSELIWRDFFTQILFHFPHVEKSSFRPEYEKVEWRTSKSEFDRWCEGQTGYPIVDAGMRELNQTGYMHNRVRMITASFLTKHLLMHWYQGERYFAEKLLDYELASNNGNWQWAAGTGCDAAPYFRIFNPEAQTERFDKNLEYIRKWVPEFETTKYPKPMIDHKEARERALATFAKALKGKKS